MGKAGVQVVCLDYGFEDRFGFDSLREATKPCLEDAFVAVHCAKEGFETMDLVEARDKFGEETARTMLPFTEIEANVVAKTDGDIYVVRVVE